MKIVIQTQIRENYGAHDWDGKGECPQYWKFKGGETYIVPNLSEEQVAQVIDLGMPTLIALIEERNEYYEEYVQNWASLDDDLVVSEPWETPYNLYWEEGCWVARRVIPNDQYGYMRQDIGSKTEQYDMQMGGLRENYTATYTMRDGRILSNTELEQALQAA